jgi:hypothetical protein
LCEDLDLSYRAQLAGWKFIYLSDVVTPAELPVDMNGFKSQQHRWTKGSVQTCKKLLPSVWRSHLPFRIKLGSHRAFDVEFRLPAAGNALRPFISCYWWTSRLAGSHTAGRHSDLSRSIGVGRAFLHLCPTRVTSRTWIKELLFLPCLLALGIGLSLNNARAVLEAMINHQSDFTRTPKYGNRTQVAAMAEL